MIPKNLPQDILQQIASIDCMERGKLSVIERSSGRSYFNLQHREGGRNVTEYVPAEQVAQAQENIEAYRRFEELVGQYVDVISTQSRQARRSGFKKKSAIKTSDSPKKPRSKNP